MVSETGSPVTLNLLSCEPLTALHFYLWRKDGVFVLLLFYQVSLQIDGMLGRI